MTNNQNMPSRDGDLFYHGVKGEKYRFLLVGEELGDKSKGSRNCDRKTTLLIETSYRSRKSLVDGLLVNKFYCIMKDLSTFTDTSFAVDNIQSFLYLLCKRCI